MALSINPWPLRADQIEMQNGDRYVGTVLSLNTTTLVLHSEVLGDLTLPRSKVSLITLRPPSATNLLSLSLSSTNARQPALSAPRTNRTAEPLPVGFRLLASNTNLIDKVTAPILGDAGPEAQAKFHELMGGLMSGKLSVDDIRAQARSALQQVKSLKREAGDDTGALDGYLTILEKFLGDSTPDLSSTNAPTSKTGP